ncbi:hypothetical protein CGCA056_v014993 [Colletotrichum aenigma]|uniref:uncharacterized protein n=1 Tax=Colletotrichum aenigma TaxID=1215731 RepID=UPI0018730072|nr:uncharacterized protein CGCA056_v014993 [Colletotrichum aenigma]KAF5498158.1 hypothetical protein CGCA056_v014993 [Colletotrichum aenigma]
MCLISPQKVTGVRVASVVGAYNPQILEEVAASKRHYVCTEAFRSVMGFYGCDYSEPEVHDLAHMFSYQLEKSEYPITSREGALSRDIGWVDKVFICDYSKLGHYIESFNDKPQTITCLMYLSNFSNLMSKHN